METDVRAIPLEVQALLRQPVQAAQKTSFTILGFIWEPELLDLSIFSVEDWTLVETALTNVGVSEEERADWLGDVRKGCWDALIALELTLFPHLEALVLLDVGDDYDGKLRWVKKLMEKVAASQGGDDRSAVLLPELREVRFGVWDMRNGSSIEDLVLFMSVPSVQQLEAFVVCSEHWEAPPGAAFSLKELRFGYCAIDSRALRNLIGCCPHLKKLSYDVSSNAGYAMFIPSVLSPALAALKECLQKLEIIDYEGSQWDDPDYGNSEEPMASFADFRNLHTLSLRACMLVGKDACNERGHESVVKEGDARQENPGPRTARLVDVVPMALKKLSLSDCGSGIQGHLKELLARKEELTPVLEHIEIAADCPIDEKAAQMLVHEFGERRVLLEFLEKIPDMS